MDRFKLQIKRCVSNYSLNWGKTRRLTMAFVVSSTLLTLVVFQLVTAPLQHRLIDIPRPEHYLHDNEPLKSRKRDGICFVSAIYAISTEEADQPVDVSNLFQSSDFIHFFLYTNMPHLVAPGWNKIIYFDASFKRLITLSRWGKFMAWNDRVIQDNCKVVFYMDGFTSPKASADRFKQEADRILQSSVGFAQHPHPDGGIVKEFKRIRRYKKDIIENIKASKRWLMAQPDFHWDCTLYENTFIGYNPMSESFQKASMFFWDRYSKELDSWRDQPLWCYVIQHFNVTPIELGSRAELFQLHEKHMGHGASKGEGALRGKHFHDESANAGVQQFLSKATNLIY